MFKTIKKRRSGYKDNLPDRTYHRRTHGDDAAGLDGAFVTQIP